MGLRAGAAAPVRADAAGNPDCGVPPCSGFIDLCEALVAGRRIAPVRSGAGRRGGLPAFVGYGAMVVLLALIAAAECGAAKRVKAVCNVNS